GPRSLWICACLVLPRGGRTPCCGCADVGGAFVSTPQACRATGEPAGAEWPTPGGCAPSGGSPPDGWAGPAGAGRPRPARGWPRPTGGRAGLGLAVRLGLWPGPWLGARRHCPGPAAASVSVRLGRRAGARTRQVRSPWPGRSTASDRKSTRLNSSHVKISYAVFCLKKKTRNNATVDFTTRRILELLFPEHL